MEKYGLPAPEFYEERDSFKVILRNSNIPSGQQTSGQQNTIEYNKTKLLEYCKEPKTAKEIRTHLNIKSRQYVSTYLINPLINEGKLEYTNKHLNARNQKYISK